MNDFIDEILQTREIVRRFDEVMTEKASRTQVDAFEKKCHATFSSRAAQEKFLLEA